MSRPSKDRSASDRPKAPEAEADLRQSPFKQALSGWKAAQAKQASPVPARKPPPPPPGRPSKDARKSAASASDDAAFFRWAMEGVQPISNELADVDRLAPTIAEVDEEAEALARLAELVAGEGHIDLADTDEYVEGLVRGVDPSLLVPLKRGDFSVQAHVDLHGLTAQAARDEVERFLVESRRQGRRCVLVVHGRGLHSKDQVPVIKERLGVWLGRGRLAKIVLAFCTARPVDGGAGALYVLLRR